jgi:hypothetical protein
MRKMTLSIIVLASLFAPVLAAAPAWAAPVKVWVSKDGSVLGTCGAVTSPCLTFQAAHDNVAAGGEIGVLTPGDYGPVRITKSVSITNDGTGEASILLGQTANGGVPGRGVFIDADAGAVVGLRGLVIDGQGVGSIGIQVLRASAVHIQNCVIRNFEAPPSDTWGILLQPFFHTQVFISDTIIFNNGSGANTGGIQVLPLALSGTGPGSARVVLDRVHLENNVVGLLVDGSRNTGGDPAAGDGAHVVVRDSVVSGNAAAGILAITVPGGAPAFIVVERSSIVNNTGDGMHADGPRATMLLNDNTVARNGTGISAVSFGQLMSYGNNRVNNNLGPDGTPTGSYSPI